jgi:hypothetical protein
MSVDALVAKVAKLDYARILAVKGISLFPGGAALSSIADALIPAQDTSFEQWQSIREYAKIMVQDMIKEYDSWNLSNQLEGLRDIIHSYERIEPGKSDRLRSFRAIRDHFDDKHAFFLPKDIDARQKLPFFVSMGTLYLTYLYDRAYNFKKCTDTDNDDRNGPTGDLMTLYEAADTYINLAAQMREDCITYRQNHVMLGGPEIIITGEPQFGQSTLGRRVTDDYDSYHGLVLADQSDDFEAACQKARQDRIDDVMPRYEENLDRILAPALAWPSSRVWCWKSC